MDGKYGNIKATWINGLMYPLIIIGDQLYIEIINPLYNPLSLLH